MRLNEIDILHGHPPGTAAETFSLHQEELKPGLWRSPKLTHLCSAELIHRLTA